MLAIITLMSTINCISSTSNRNENKQVNHSQDINYMINDCNLSKLKNESKILLISILFSFITMILFIILTLKDEIISESLEKIIEAVSENITLLLMYGGSIFTLILSFMYIIMTYCTINCPETFQLVKTKQNQITNVTLAMYGVISIVIMYSLYFIFTSGCVYFEFFTGTNEMFNNFKKDSTINWSSILLNYPVISYIILFVFKSIAFIFLVMNGYICLWD